VIREISALSRLKECGGLKLYGVGKGKEFVFEILEVADGNNLRKYLRQN